jgi:DNA polymerase V
MTYALVDCNSFYASCERIFRPDLKTKPVVVLSNNDGCVVALSKEAKELGIKMCEPWFKIKDQFIKQGGVAFSSNYELYADISSRVMQTLEQLAPKIEIYSIDEAFLDLKGIDSCMQLDQFGSQCRDTIQQWVGMPVSVGIGPTKTLAKVAQYGANL